MYLKAKKRRDELTFTAKTKDEVIEILTRLGFSVSESTDIFEVTVPTRRIDISIKEDIIEEESDEVEGEVEE
mgnify:CR=1 FL=1